MKRVELCAITPQYDLFSACEGDRIFLQADWCRHLAGPWLDIFQQYRKDKYVIIDNQHPVDNDHSVSLVNPTTLIETAYRINANEIIIPDVLHEKDATLRNAEAFIYKYHPLPYRMMFVPQGTTFFEWVDCYNSMMQSDWCNEIDVIGVPKWLGELRWQALEHIDPTFEVHFLGLAEGWNGLQYHPRIRSWDTSLMYAVAQRGLKFTDVPSTKKYPLEEDVVALYPVFKRNIYIAKTLLTASMEKDGD